jgi:hypothetical protein
MQLRKRLINKRILSILLLLSACALIGLAIWMQVHWKNLHKKRYEDNKKEITSNAKQKAQELSDLLTQPQKALLELVQNIPSWSHEQIQEKMLSMMTSDGYEKTGQLKIRTVGVAWKNGDLIRYQQNNGRPELKKLSYNHTDPNIDDANWYHELFKTPLGRGRWLPPYHGATSQIDIWECGMPFTDQNGQKAGVAYFNFSMEEIRQVLAQLHLGRKDYVFVVSKKSDSDQYMILHHPHPDYSGETLQSKYPDEYKRIKEELSRPKDDNAWKSEGVQIYVQAIENHGTIKSTFEQQSLIFVIDQDGRPLGASQNKKNENSSSSDMTDQSQKKENENPSSSDMTDQSQKKKNENLFLLNMTDQQVDILFSLFICASLLLLIIFFVVIRPRQQWHFVMLSGLFSLLCMVEIIFIWWGCHYGQSIHNRVGDEITGSAMAYAFADRLLDQCTTHDGEHRQRHYQEIGIFIQSVKFLSPYEIGLTGYLWEKKATGTPDKKTGSIKYFSEGDNKYSPVVFPEAEQISITKRYENDRVIGSYFETILRQPFDYKKFPFDVQDIWVRIWPKRFTNFQTVLIPDFASYTEEAQKQEHFEGGKKTQKKSSKGYMGLENDLPIEGWKVDRTYFSYRKKNYTSNFGTGLEKITKERPELHFNIQVRRGLGSVIISHVLPILIISILLFGVTMTKTADTEKKELLGFSVSTVLAYCASLFFVLIVSHINLRETLATPSFVYLEGFYFAMYLHLLFVSLYDILFVHSPKNSIIRQHDAALLKLLYWPVLTGLMLLVTFCSFY